MPTELPEPSHPIRTAGSMRLDPQAEGLPTEETQALIAAHKVEGRPVFDRGGERLGEIAAVMLEKRMGLVAYAVLASAGVLDFGKTHRALPWRSLSYDPALGGYVVDDAAAGGGEVAAPEDSAPAVAGNSASS